MIGTHQIANYCDHSEEPVVDDLWTTRSGARDRGDVTDGTSCGHAARDPSTITGELAVVCAYCTV
jgi:hypothetical protein